jgi:hypothetical protein
VITAVLAQVAVSAYASTLVGTPAEVEAALAPFRELLIALGTPSFAELAQVVQPGDLAGYREAYETGVRVAMLGAGVIALVGAAIAWLALGRRNPLQTVYDHRDERGVAAA